MAISRLLMPALFTIAILAFGCAGQASPQEGGSKQTPPAQAPQPPSDECLKYKGNSTLKTDICYLAKYLDTGDSGFCSKIPGADRRNYCMGRAKEDMGTCLLISDASLRDGCIEYVAEARQNESLCDLMSGYMFECISNISIEKGNVSICNRLSPQPGYDYASGRDVCYISYASSTKDPSLCTQLWCNRSVANCDWNVDYCYWSVARDSKNASLCSLIYDAETREDCINLSR
ncbi:MAG: hypothetical protein WC861_00850 [Candidatus Micrarchaeia archaeon]|jgi:hypothetical protein